MRVLLLAIGLLICLTFSHKFFFHKEGFEEDYLGLTIYFLENALKDSRMNEKQVMALQDALSYARYIKYDKPVPRT